MNRDNWTPGADAQRSRRRANNTPFASEDDKLVMRIVVLFALGLLSYFLWQFTR